MSLRTIWGSRTDLRLDKRVKAIQIALKVSGEHDWRTESAGHPIGSIEAHLARFSPIQAATSSLVCRSDCFGSAYV